MSIKLLDSVCLQTEDDFYVFLGLVFAYGTANGVQVKPIAVGNRRDLLMTFSRFAVEGNGEETSCLRYNNMPYKQDELFQLLEDSISQAVSAKDFMKAHEVHHFCCSAVINGKIQKDYPRSNHSLAVWTAGLRVAQKKGQAVSDITCKPVLSDKTVELIEFKHGDVRDTGDYAIRQKDRFYVIPQLVQTDAADVGATISVFSWSNAVRMVSQFYLADGAVVVPLENAKCFLIRAVGSKGKSYNGYAYTTLGAASKAAQKLKSRKITDADLEIDRYVYNDGWVLEEKNCYTGPVKYAIQYTAGPNAGAFFLATPTGAQYSDNPRSFPVTAFTYDTQSAALKRAKQLPKDNRPKPVAYIYRNKEWVCRDRECVL